MRHVFVYFIANETFYLLKTHNEHLACKIDYESSPLIYSSKYGKKYAVAATYGQRKFLSIILLRRIFKYKTPTKGIQSSNPLKDYTLF